MISSKAEVQNSDLKGKGLFAKEPIELDEVVIEFEGEFIDKEGAEAARRAGKLTMQWDENLFSVEDRGEDVTYFVNHSCDSNLWMKDAKTLVARKPIKVGEEITADYALWEADENFVSTWNCQCGSSLCQKKATGKDWQKKELQERYRDHFSPLINKKISNVNS